jgi:hypothetical protein
LVEEPGPCRPGSPNLNNGPGPGPT